jgi:Tol biopolymer transport system component
MRIIYLLLLILLVPIEIWSQSTTPDRVMFSSYRPQGWDIFISDKLTKSLNQITFHESLDYNPEISPDGKWIVFTSERLGNPSLFIKSLDGESSPQLLIEGDDSMQDQSTISPDQKWLVFTSTHEGNSDIYRIPFQPDTTLSVHAAKNLTQDKGGDFRPSFSSDGSKIVFSSDRHHPIKAHARFVFAMVRTADIYSMDLEGGNLNRITQNESWDGSPCFSESGDLIYFYSKQEDTYRICSINQNGEKQTVLSPKEYNATSPVILDDSTLVFTTWEGREFQLMSLNLNSKKVTPLFDNDNNFLGAKIGKNRLLAFYGGPPPSDQTVNQGGFSGDILVKGSPYLQELNDKSIELYGIRRAFAAPPSPNESAVVFDHSNVSNLNDAFTKWTYALIFILLLYVLLLVRGNIKLRKSNTKIRLNISFSLLVIFQVILLSAILYYFFFAKRVPINTMQSYMGITAFLFLLGTGFAQTRKTRPFFEQIRNSFFISLVSSLILVLIIPLIIQIPIQFYKANYLTKEVTLIHDFIKPTNYNPLNGMVIDTKLSPLGDELIYTVGSFRGGPEDQGDVFTLNLKNFKSERISKSDFNDGFGDISSDKSKVVFRSGRSGYFDIYLKQGNEIKNLTEDMHRDNFPIISPQGNKIVFCSDRLGTDIEGKVKTMDIFLFELNEKGEWEGPVRLTDDKGQDAHPHFSPDGEWVIYSSEEGGINDEEPLVKPIIFGPQTYGEIFAIHISTRRKIRITHNKWEDGAPLWTKGI